MSSSCNLNVKLEYKTLYNYISVKSCSAEILFLGLSFVLFADIITYCI